jgi:hypothetical protein
MFRRLACLVLSVALVPTVARAQQPGEPIRLLVSPASLSTPRLKYRLLPDPRELTTGNAATLYYRSMAMLYENNALLQDLKGGHWSDWVRTPLKDLPRKEVQEKLNLARNLFHELDLAAQCRTCDWQIDGRKEGFGLLLPEVQGFRSVASALAVRARYQIATGDWARALTSFQTGYALARNLGEGPTLIHVLVGNAVAHLMHYQVEEFVAQPGAANLYWSLMIMPRPFFNLEHASLEEGRMVENMLPWVKQLDKGPMTAAQLQAGLTELRAELDRFGLRRPALSGVLGQSVLIMGAYPEAKKALLARDFTAEQLEAMPNLQVVALYAFREYRESSDELLMWSRVPNGFKHKGYQESRERARKAMARLDLLFFSGLLTALTDGEPAAIERVQRAVHRTDRRLAALACVEALRLYAASHEGKWPTNLEEITEVPVPVDPVTGKPFEYELNGEWAVLSIPIPPDEKPQRAELLTYHLKLRPREK